MTKAFTDTETQLLMGKLEMRMSSAAVALYDDMNRVLVVKAHYKKYWSLPGGVVDPGETPRVAAAREVYEETGILPNVEMLKFCMVVDRVSAVAQTYQLVFDQQVDSDTFSRVRLDPREIEDYALVTREDIVGGDRYYSESTIAWAKGFTGYMEQWFGPDRPDKV